jgi:hypothetical protein
LNRERWFNGGKAALSETAKHCVDNIAVARLLRTLVLKGFGGFAPSQEFHPAPRPQPSDTILDFGLGILDFGSLAQQEFQSANCRRLCLNRYDYRYRF